MNVSSEWVNSVNYWVQRLRMQDSGSFSMAAGRPIGPVPQRTCLFELKTSLTPGNTVSAYQVLDDGSGGWTTDTSQYTNLVDWLHRFRGLGRDDTGTSGGAHGAYAFALHDDYHGSPDFASDKWLITAMQEVSRLILITAPADEAANATFTVSSCTVLDDGQDPTLGASAHITNWDQKLCSGKTAICVPDGSGTTRYYRVIDAPCPTC